MSVTVHGTVTDTVTDTKRGEKAGAGNKPGSVEDNHSSGIAVTGYL